jgi:hypothetical protein
MVFLFATVPAFAQDANTKKPSAVIPTFGIGVSYPMLLSASVGAMVPLSAPIERYPGFPGVTALRADVDIGLGGGMIAAGLSIPSKAGYGSAKVNLKGAALRTWGWSFDRPLDRTYHGAIAELSVYSHPAGKLGIGYFQDAGVDRSRFLFVYLGLGI